MNEAVAHREIEGQIVLLLPDDYELYTLNASGKLVWQELLEGRTVERDGHPARRDVRHPSERAGADVAGAARRPGGPRGGAAGMTP